MKLRAVASIWGSYEGHMAHADSWRLQQQFRERFPWLASIAVRRRFPAGADNQVVLIRRNRP